MKNKIIILIIILVVGDIVTLSLAFKEEDSTLLENVETTNTFKTKKQMFTIMVENDNNYEYHEYEDKSKWPDKNTYTYAGSLCADWGGNNINENLIKFDEVNYKVTITTKKTAYCTLYFTKGKKALTHLQAKGGSKFNSTSAVFGLYRFKGTKDDVTNHDLNNYICFGTTDIETCTGADKQYYMYRIIGITDGSTTNTALGLEANQLKIIRAYPSNIDIALNSQNSDIPWDEMDIVDYLNNEFLQTDKLKWKNTYWEGIINESKWYIGTNTNANATTETTTVSTSEHRVGLMYKSDFFNAGQVGQSVGRNNWLFISNGMNGSPTNTTEWTMTNSSTTRNYSAWAIWSDGKFDTRYLNLTRAVRPVFYLISNVTLTGEGTEESPFIITSKN